jgi:signal transduction histidine kinase
MLVENGFCRVVCSRGIPPEREAWINQADFHVDSLPSLTWMYQTHKACWIPDTAESELWHAVEGTDHIRSYIGAPMFVEEELIGFIHVDNFLPHTFTAVQAEHLQAFANQVALIVHNMRLHDQLTQYAEVLEQKVAERTAELAQANEELRALARVKDEFVANVSHELRTPITNLILRQTLLEKMPEKQAKHLDVMRRETQRLNRIIEPLVLVHKLNSAIEKWTQPSSST